MIVKFKRLDIVIKNVNPVYGNTIKMSKQLGIQSARTLKNIFKK
jgi:hypothetical protein